MFRVSRIENKNEAVFAVLADTVQITRREEVLSLHPTHATASNAAAAWRRATRLEALEAQVAQLQAQVAQLQAQIQEVK